MNQRENEQKAAEKKERREKFDKKNEDLDCR